ncbi:hypothetical protein [Pseudonocardia xishanensis]|uniref:Protein tyrosine phosphatase n=1 Tax=Pseudonocardia xishanensis TaxID=630995 RepID=A0ABP8RVB5_9PSEU
MTTDSPRPALGTLRALPGRRIAVRAAVLLALLVAAVAVRETGILHADRGGLPALPAAAAVVPGVYRSGAPTEAELALMRDTFRTRGLVAVGRPAADEQAAAPALGIRLLRIDVPDGGAPTAAQLGQVRDLLREVRADGSSVLLHDATGTGPVVVTAAAVQLLDGRALEEVTATPGLSDADRRVLTDIAEALAGRAAPTDPYSSLTR